MSDPEEVEERYLRYQLQQLENRLRQHWADMLAQEWHDREFVEKFLIDRPVLMAAPVLPAVADLEATILRIQQSLAHLPPTTETVSQIRHWFEQQLYWKTKAVSDISKERQLLLQTYRQGIGVLDVEISEQLGRIMLKYRKPPVSSSAPAATHTLFPTLKQNILTWVEQHEATWRLESRSLLQTIQHPKPLRHFLEQLQIHLLQEEPEQEEEATAATTTTTTTLPAAPLPPKATATPQSYAAYLQAKEQQKNYLWQQQSLKANQQKDLHRKKEEQRIQLCREWATQKPLPGWLEQVAELEKTYVDHDLQDWQQLLLRQRYITHEVRLVLQRAATRLSELNVRLLRNLQKTTNRIKNQYLVTEKKRQEEIAALIRQHHLLSEKDVQQLKQWMYYREELWKGRQFLRFIHTRTLKSSCPVSLPGPK